MVTMENSKCLPLKTLCITNVTIIIQIQIPLGLFVTYNHGSKPYTFNNCNIDWMQCWYNTGYDGTDTLSLIGQLGFINGCYSVI